MQPADKSGEIIDDEAFSMFADVMGDGLSRALARYVDCAQGYVAAATTAAASGDMAALAQAAHPLKSSSQQVGIVRLGCLAGEIEAQARAPEPDVAQVRLLCATATVALKEAQDALAARLSMPS